MAVKKNVQQNRKAFVQAKLGQTGVEATPEQRAKLRERFNTLSQTQEGRTKIAKVLLPSGTAAERAAFKKSIRPTTGTTGSTGSTTTSTTPTGMGGNPVTTGLTTTTKTFKGMGGNPITVTGVINNVGVPSNNSSSSAVVRTTPTTLPQNTTTTVPRSTTSTTVPQTTTTTVKQSNAFKSTGPSYTPSNEKDLTVPIVGGILVTGAAAVGTKAFLSSGTNIDKLTRVRQNDLARQFKASQLTSSSSLTLADRPQFASVKDQQAIAAAKTATVRPEFASVKDQRAAAAAKALAARPQFGSVADQRAAAAAKALAARPQFGSVASQRAAAAARTAAGATGGTRSVLEGIRSFMSGGLRKGAK
jgi:hypothetical protein